MKLKIGLIPETSWRENLRTKMGRTKWDKLRKQILAEQGDVCRICSATEKLQCHEVWKFDDRSNTQRLVGFEAVCSLCHLSEHFGLAQNLAKQGHVNLDDVISHFMRVNGITKKEFEAHRAQAFAVWHERSAKQWEVDLGEWASLV
jgi:hypothetical protein